MVFKKGNTPWNKGKTKETDPRVARSGEIQSKTKKKLFSKGKLIPWNKGRHKNTPTTSRIPAICAYCGKSITKLGKGSHSLFTKNNTKYHRTCYFKTPAFTDKMSKIGIENWKDKTARSNRINGLKRTAQAPPRELDKTEVCTYCGENITYRVGAR